jgi:hypothetical protein
VVAVGVGVGVAVVVAVGVGVGVGVAVVGVVVVVVAIGVAIVVAIVVAIGVVVAIAVGVVKLSIRCHEPVQAHKAMMAQLWPMLNSSLLAGHKMVLELRPETRSMAENAMLHALLTAISNKIEWAGKKRDVEVWKRLITAAWLRARGEGIELLPAIDGHGVDVVFRHTSKLTRAECAELIEYVQAFCAEHGIDTGEVDPITGQVLSRTRN